MKSIRLSLILYFSILLLLSLGAVLGLLYQTTDLTLKDKLNNRRDLLQNTYKTQCQQLENEFDGHVLQRAQTLASLAQAQYTRTTDRRKYYSLGLLTAVINPQPHLLVPLWVGESTETHFSSHLLRISFTKIHFAEDVMLGRGEDDRPRDYFQVYNQYGATLQHSRSMGGASFQLDDAQLRKSEWFKPTFDNARVGEIPVRRVTLKTPVTSSSFQSTLSSDRPRPSTPRPPRQPSSPSRVRFDRPTDFFFIQFAGETAQRDETLAGYKDTLNKELANSEAEYEDTWAKFKTRLVWIGAITFAATLIGSFFLVGFGLMSLRRLSDAVSRVSEKDISLQFNPAQLPPELRPIAERLSQTLELLRRAFAREKQAAADISHELRTPLAALLTTLEVALRRPRSSEEYTDILKDCCGICQQMTQLVERLLVLARIDAGVDSARSQEVDVATLAQQCVSLVRPLAEARDLTLQLHLKEESRVRLITDPGKLREILTNLLHNAVEYNRPNGRIDVTVERHNGTLRVNVADTGIGISSKAKGHIFERFYRADSSRQAEGLHAGVGLSIVKGYVDLMGGTIDVESTEGAGSTFCLQLPA